MKVKLIGWLAFLVILLTACTGAAVTEQAETSTLEVTPTEVVARMLPTATSPPTATATSEPTSTTPPPTATPEPTATEPAVAENQATSCADPFEGERVRFARSHWTKTDFCKHSVPYGEIRSGGPPPDGIPPIDHPTFETVEEAEGWLAPTEPVIALELEGIARAYPLQILTWHEIVNDEVADVPVAVTFCPLCNAAIVFDRRVDGQVLSFGTTGNLRNSDLVMWDRQTESWWQQFTGEAIVGAYTGTQLTFLPAPIISWVDFKNTYPDGEVLSQDTGFSRSYGVNPYAGYDDINSSPFLFERRPNAAMPPMARVAAVELGDTYVAYPFDLLTEVGVINDKVGEQELVVFWKAGTNTALGGARIRDARDIGSTGIFDRLLDGQTLTFETDGEFFRDQQTGSRWTLLGEAVEGRLAGQRLTRLIHHEYFWFAWAAFRPDTIVYEQ